MAVSPNSLKTGVSFVRTGGTTWVEASGASWPVVAESGFTLMGDSLTTLYGPKFAVLLPTRSVYMNGIGGSITRCIAQRYGAFPITLGLAGNQIPASGPVSVTVTSGRTYFLYASSDDICVRVSIQGLAGEVIEGTLAYAPGSPGTSTFTRDVSGSAVNVSPAAPTTVLSGIVTGTSIGSPTTLVDLLKRQLVIWTGRNDISSGPNLSQMLQDVDAMVRFQKTLNKRYLVIGVTASMADVPTAQGGQQPTDAAAVARLNNILAFNSALSAAYGVRYLDMVAALDALGVGYCSDFTISGTVYRVLNATYGSDGIHPNSGAPRNDVTQIIKDKLITELGW